MIVHKTFWELCSDLEALLELDRKAVKECEERGDFAAANEVLAGMFVRSQKLKQIVERYEKSSEGKSFPLELMKERKIR